MMSVHVIEVSKKDIVVARLEDRINITLPSLTDSTKYGVSIYDDEDVTQLTDDEAIDKLTDKLTINLNGEQSQVKLVFV